MNCHFCGEPIGNQICPACGHDVDPEGLQAENARLRAELTAARQWAAAWKRSAHFHRRFEDYGPNNYRAMRRLDEKIDAMGEAEE